MSATTKWIALALLGLAIAGGVAFAASRLVSEQIGIASESVSAGYDLAPAVRSVTAPAGNGAPNADKLDELEKQREDELEEQLKEREDREDEIRDREEDRRDD